MDLNKMSEEELLELEREAASIRMERKSAQSILHLQSKLGAMLPKGWVLGNVRRKGEMILATVTIPTVDHATTRALRLVLDTRRGGVMLERGGLSAFEFNLACTRAKLAEAMRYHAKDLLRVADALVVDLPTNGDGDGT